MPGGRSSKFCPVPYAWSVRKEEVCPIYSTVHILMIHTSVFKLHEEVFLGEMDVHHHKLVDEYTDSSTEGGNPCALCDFEKSP